MGFGMALGRIAPPRPPSPSFSRVIPTTISPHAGKVTIQFYTPRHYRSTRLRRKPNTYFPVVINFHGGGFTLGSATDDARWAGCVVERTGAVVASVDYRLAPEFPFPTAVEDGVDAVLYVARCARELWLDAERIAISGFSCGGNLAFTVPLRLKEELDPALDRDGFVAAVERGVHHGGDGATLGKSGRSRATYKKADDREMGVGVLDGTGPETGGRAKTGADGMLNPHPRHGLVRLRSGIKEGGVTYTPTPSSPRNSTDDDKSPPSPPTQTNPPRTASVDISGNAASMSAQRQRTLHPTNPGARPSISVSAPGHDAHPATQPQIHLRIPAVISWYPSTDYTLTRDERRATLARKDMELSPVFTSLFDASYIASVSAEGTPSSDDALGRRRPPPQKEADGDPLGIVRSNPFLSPGVAPEALLRSALPDNILMVTCEYDMLRAEGLRLKGRLEGLGKRVSYRMVEGVPHGWDKSPNPFREARSARAFYGDVCGELRGIFEGSGGVGGAG